MEIHATGSATNSGIIKGGTQTVVRATNILNRGGSIGSSTDNGTTVVSATNDVVNASGRITGNRVAVLAGHDIVNTTLVDTVGVSSAVGNSKVGQSLLGAQGTIASTGDLLVVAGNDLAVHGASIAAGGNAQIAAGHDITVDTVQSDTSQSVTKNADQHWEASSTINQTGAITAGGSLAMQSGNDTTLKGATVRAGGDMAVVAGGNLTATTVTNTATYNNVAADDKTRKQADRSYDEQAVGTNVSAGGSAMLAAVTTDVTNGNVTLTGSLLSTDKGAANIVATGNVTLNEAREEHESYSASESKRGSIVHGSTTDKMNASQANIGVGSVVSGDTVNIRSGKDLTVQGSNMVGTNDVTLAATGNVNITTSQDTQSTQSDYEKREYGFLSGLNPLNQLDGGLQGYSIGVRKTTDAQQATQVTNNGSMVGSLNSNLTVASGNDLHVTGSTLHAGNDLNRALYDGSSLGISGGYGGDIGKNQKGTADNVNPVPGTTLPGAGGFSMAPPVALSASGDASGTTNSGISGGSITITDSAKQQQLTGQTAEEAVASINRDTGNTQGTIAPIFDKDKIEAGFDITGQFINQVGTFVNNRAKEADAAKAAANDPKLTPEQRTQAQQQADQLNAEWGPGGSYRQVLTALSVAAGGNVTGGMGQFAQGATVAYLQELGANGVKQIADSLGSDEARAALHAIVGCAGAAASSQSCGAGAMGASASSVIGSLLGPTTNMSAANREARENLVHSLVAGIAAAGGVNAATATGAGQIEVQNNQVSLTTTTGFRLPPIPGFKGEAAGKGDGVIADPATELDPTIKAGALVTPAGDPRLIDQIFTPVGDAVKGLVDYVTTSMLGENGPQVASKTIWKGDGKERIDVENPNPGQRPGQIHYQDNAGNKYLYDPTTNTFPDAPNSVTKLLSDPGFNAAIQKGFDKYLGGNR